MSASGDVGDAWVGCVAYDPSRDLLYAGMYAVGSSPAGVWSCRNPGNSSSWSKISASGDVGDLRVYDMAYDETRNKIYTACFTYIGTKQGIWRCDNPDGAFGWERISSGSYQDNGETYTIAFDQKRNLLYASLYQSGGYDGIHRCVAPDESHTWESLSGITISFYTDIVCDSMHDLVYVTTPHYGVFRGAAPDGATVWTNVYDKTEGQYQWGMLASDGPGSNLYGGIGQMGAWQAPLPGVVSCSPEKAGRDQTVNVEIAGGNTNFINGTSEATFSGSGITVLSTTVSDVTHATARVRLAGDAELGARDVTVTTGAETADTLFDGFTVEHAAPTISGMSPGSGVTGTNPVHITDLAGTGFYGTPTVKLKKSGQTDINGTDVVRVSAAKLTCKLNLANAAPGAWDVVVTNPDAQSATRSAAFTVTKPVPPTPATTPTWYLAEGTTSWGFSTYITIENPNTSAVHAAITYMTGTGNVSGGTITLPAMSQTTLNPADKLGNKDFSTQVTCKEGKAIAVDRTMTWTGPGAASEEAHSSVGVTSPSKTWYLPEGSSAWGFECWLLIQNPNSSAANCKVTYMIEGVGPQEFTKTVPANSRATFDMSKDIGAKDASIKVESNVPVIPERAMYRNSRREGHDSIGTTAPARDFYLAEGATGYNVGYISYVLVQNPQPTPTDVSLTYQTQSGEVAGPVFQMPANSRKTIRVNDQLPANTDVSTKVHGSQPIIAERAMYWDNGTGEACHDSIGMSSPHTTFYLPDGETSNGRETWTLVQNPNTTNVTVEITYLTPTGQGNVVKTESIPASSRKTFNMAEHSKINGRASIMVRSKTSGKKIMVERAMYWNSRGAGTDTIGGFAD